MKPLFQENVPMAPFTTLGVGGPARYLVRADHEAAVEEAHEFARNHRLPFFVLGGGSNIVFSDEGFPGVVLHIAICGRELLPNPGQANEKIIRAGAGENWDEFVDFCVGQNLAGIECLSGIPGTVGGTPVQNVGAYGQEVSSVIRSVRVYDRREGLFSELDTAACRFSYRRSIFNTREHDRYIVLSVTYALEVDGKPLLRYADLQHQFPDSSTPPSLWDVRSAVRNIRRRKAMLLMTEDPDSRSVGSFFKNPLVEESFYRKIADQYPGIRVPHYPVAGEASRVKLAAAWLIEQSGLSKGYPAPTLRPSRVGISTKHTLAIVNRGGATARDILDLMEEIQSKVREHFGVQLEPEPVFVGFGDPA